MPHLLLALLLAAAPIEAGDRPLVPFRTHLAPNAERPWPERIDIVFRAYADRLGGPVIWTEAHSEVPVTDEAIEVDLGSIQPLPARIFRLERFWLEIQAGGVTDPRRRPVRVAPLDGSPGKAQRSAADSVETRLQDGRRILLRTDFGPDRTGANGVVSIGEGGQNDAIDWIAGRVRTRCGAPARLGPLLGDFVEGFDATLAVAVAPADSLFRVALTFVDPDADRGPWSVVAGDSVVADRLISLAGEPSRIAFDVRAAGGRLRVRIRSAGCDGWALAAMDIYGPPGARLTRLSAPAESISAVPPADQARRHGWIHPDSLLRRCCEFLIARQPGDGGFNSSGSWYQNAYPVRTLLAGSSRLGEPTWRQAAFTCLDYFVERQLPDGNWYSTYWRGRGCPGLVGQDTSSANLADIGSMAACLAMAAPQSDEPRRQAYLSAARRYVEQIVLPAQMPDGAFPNGWFDDKDHACPYSVATATQAVNLAALWSATRVNRYREAADRAGLWLAGTIQPDGTLLFYPHDKPDPVPLPASSFGNSFYVAEALIWVEHATSRQDVRRATRSAVDRFLWGPKGAMADTQKGCWWAPRDPWNDSKTGGILFVLAGSARWHHDTRLVPWVRQALAWMADPSRNPQINFEDRGSDRPLPPYAMVATGFTGIGLAALADQPRSTARP